MSGIFRPWIFGRVSNRDRQLAAIVEISPVSFTFGSEMEGPHLGEPSYDVESVGELFHPSGSA